MKIKKNHLAHYFTVLALLLVAVGFWDKPLAVGLAFFILLTCATVFTMRRLGIIDKRAYIIFFVALVIHAAAALFIYYGHFNPFGGGADYDGYNTTAIELAHRFSGGNFSLKGLYTEHFFPILMAVIYMVTLPDMLVGQLFVVWLAAVSILLAYLVVLEMGGTKKAAFLTGFAISIYPSYLFFGSVLLKDTLVIPLIMAGLFLALKMTKNFSWPVFVLFFIILTCLVDLRFYVGYALMISFLISWMMLSVIPLKKRMGYLLVMAIILGFSPLILGNGYYGFNSFKKFLNFKEITYFREVVYGVNSPLLPKPIDLKPIALQPTAPQPIVLSPSSGQPAVNPPPLSVAPASPPQQLEGSGSTFVLETGFNKGIFVFLKNSTLSFAYSLLGPFPWQLKNKRQIAGLAETIPWYILIGTFLYIATNAVRKKGISGFLAPYRLAIPLLIFSIVAMGALSLFINNYGIIARIRIPMLMCLAAVMLMGINNSQETENT